MNQLVRFGLILALICMIASLILSVTYKFTKPVIDERMREEEKAALALIMPDADKFEQKQVGDEKYYIAYEKGKFKAYCVKVVSWGYSSYIRMLVGVDKKGIIQGVEILEQHETPGLGNQISKKSFTAQFKAKDATKIQLKDIHAITGATISSKAVVKGIHDGIDKFFVLLKKKGKP